MKTYTLTIANSQGIVVDQWKLGDPKTAKDLITFDIALEDKQGFGPSQGLETWIGEEVIRAIKRDQANSI
jgi:hypothetical protein